MKTRIFTLLLSLWLVTVSTANTIILIEVKTTADAVTYSINQQRMNVAELSAWIERGIAAFGEKDPILIQPDPNTTFVTVFALLEKLTKSGAKHFEIVAERKRAEDEFTKRSLIVESNQLKTSRSPSVPPSK